MSTFFAHRPRSVSLRKVEWVTVDPCKGFKRPTQKPALPPRSTKAGHLAAVAVDCAPFLSLPLGTLALAGAAACSANPPAVLAAGVLPGLCAQRRVIRGPVNPIVADLEGKNVVVTGASSGIGAEVAVQLATLGANVVCTGRGDPHTMKTHVRNAVVPAHIGPGEGTGSGAHARRVGKRLHFFNLDLTSLRSRREFAAAVEALPFVKDTGIHVLVNNAGGFAASPLERVPSATGKPVVAPSAALARGVPEVSSSSPGGLNRTLVTNTLGPMHVTELLLPLIRKAQDADRRVGGRVINVSSMAHTVITEPFLGRYGLDVTRRDMHAPEALEVFLRHCDNGAFGLWGHDATRIKDADKAASDPQFTLHAMTSTGLTLSSRLAAFRVYALSKLLNIYHADSLVRRGVSAASLHPGAVASGVYRDLGPAPLRALKDTQSWTTFASNALFTRAPAESAPTVVNACIRPDFVNGGYYSSTGCALHGKSPLAGSGKCRDVAMAWAASTGVIPAADRWEGRRW